jgi:copper(I)-binding protein
MSHRKHLLLMPAATVSVALGLAFGSVAAVDDDADEAMASMEPMAGMESMAPMEPGLYVRDAWTRESPMLDLAGAAYMTIHNSTDADDALIGASSPVAEVVELHLSAMDEDGMMSMTQVPEIPIPAHADAELKPGSYHIMLINLVEPLTEGTDVEITLEFMSAEPQTVSAPVGSGPMMGDMDMDMDMDMDDMGHDSDESDGMGDDTGEEDEDS